MLLSSTDEIRRKNLIYKKITTATLLASFCCFAQKHHNIFRPLAHLDFSKVIKMKQL
jgi:hypothetical protein